MCQGAGESILTMSPRISLPLLLAMVSLGSPLWAQQYEALPVLDVRTVLPQAWIGSSLHQVQPEVRIEEGLYQFVLRTVYGVEQVDGTDLLQKRIREVHATVALTEKGVGGAAVKGLVDETAGTVKNIGSAVKRPVRTVLNIPKGIGSVVKGAAGSTKNQVQDKGNYSGGIVRDWFDVSEQKLKLAAELGVDPYSDFEPLQDQFKRLGGTSTISGLGIRILVPGDGIIGMAAKGEASRQLNSVYLTAPSQLLKENRGLLQQAGVGEAAAATFFASRHWSPAEQALLVREIAEFGRPVGADDFLNAASGAADRAEAWHFLSSSRILRLLHQQGAPITGLSSFHGIPSAVSAEGRYVLPLALDRVYWTENAARLAESLLATAQASGCGGADLVIAGEMSELAVARLGAMGIRILPVRRN